MTRIAIIGGGVAGLSAGIFAQLNGFESVVLEKHHEPGGQCTGWNRQGYHIDGCIHWLVGTKEDTAINDLWKTVGALDGVEVYHPETFLTFEHDGISVPIYRDLDLLRETWKQISPADAETIGEFCDTIGQLQSFEVPADKPMDMMGLLERLRLMASMKDAGMIMKRYGKVSLKEYADNFEHPALRETLGSFLPDGYSASSVFFALATFTKGQASVPVGGSRAFSLRMAERYRTLGGRIEASCEIAELDIDGNRAVTARAEDGRTFEADYFVAACDAHFFFEGLLGGRYPDRAFRSRFENPTDYPLASQVLVSLGYEGTMDEVPRSLSFPVESFRLLGDPIDRLTVSHFGHEPDFAPEGHTLLTCAINQFHADFDAWKTLSGDPVAYRSEKERIGRCVERAIIGRFPEMAGKLRVLDVASPLTYERYCNAHRGAFMAFLPTVRTKGMAHTGAVKGLRNVFLSGQWLQPPGGLPVAVITGKDSIRRICKQLRRAFVDR